MACGMVAWPWWPYTHNHDQATSWSGFLMLVKCLWIKARGLGQGWTRPAGRAPGRPRPRAAGPRAGSTSKDPGSIPGLGNLPK